MSIGDESQILWVLNAMLCAFQHRLCLAVPHSYSAQDSHTNAYLHTICVNIMSSKLKLTNYSIRCVLLPSSS